MFVVSITGREEETRTATDELVREFPDALKTKIQPSCLARETTNQMPSWRFELQRVMSSGKVIINDMSYANCDEITDFARSVRALSNSYQPFVFSTVRYDCPQINAPYTLERVRDILFLYK